MDPNVRHVCRLAWIHPIKYVSPKIPLLYPMIFAWSSHKNLLNPSLITINNQFKFMNSREIPKLYHCYIIIIPLWYHYDTIMISLWYHYDTIMIQLNPILMRRDEHKGVKSTCSKLSSLWFLIWCRTFQNVSKRFKTFQNVSKRFKSPAGFCQSGRGSSGARKVLQGIGTSLRGMCPKISAMGCPTFPLKRIFWKSLVLKRRNLELVLL